MRSVLYTFSLMFVIAFVITGCQDCKECTGVVSGTSPADGDIHIVISTEKVCDADLAFVEGRVDTADAVDSGGNTYQQFTTFHCE